MASTDQLSQSIHEGYRFDGGFFEIGSAMLEGQVLTDARVSIPLRTLNRHGLIAGATGTGKTKTLQLLAEGLSRAAVPVLLMDLKGDLSGIAASGSVNERVQERCQRLGVAFEGEGFPVELLSLSQEAGVRLRSTVSEFGPVLLSKILGLNDTQEGIVSVLFKYADDHQLALLDLKDFLALLRFAGQDGKKEIEASYGNISPASLSTILRKVVELEQQDGDIFFGEPSFDVDDLMRISGDGRGMISVIRVTDMQNRTKLFSTFMLGLLAELFAALPEEGDLDKPKLVFFIDEAHLLFNGATEALLQQIETVIRLIRSKGVGIIFCTQNPQDIPVPVLGQLGLKVQHALRAFTAADRKTIRKAAENYPESSFYKVDELLTQMGIGEALVTLLNEKGIPTPLAHTYLRPPSSRMDVLTVEEISNLVAQSALAEKYRLTQDRESAHEILTSKMEAASAESREKQANQRRATPKEEPSVFDHPAMRQAGRTAAAIITRSLLGALGIGKSRKRR